MRTSIARALQTLCVLAVAWGAFAFAAVYPWAYTPLALACAAIGTAALVMGRSGHPPLRPLAVALLVVGGTIALQLVPLPRTLLASISPGVDGYFSRIDFAWSRLAPQAAPWHPLSLSPADTVRGLLLFASFALFMLGTARIATAVGGRGLASTVIAVGVVLSLVGMGQLAMYPAPTPDAPTYIYGVWRPTYFSFPFGPFINRNHFAGWVVMVLPLALAYFWEGLQRALDDASSIRRDITGFTNSPQFSSLVTSGGAVAVMGVALALTRSRSGLVAFAVGAVLATAVVMKRQSTGRQRAIVAAGFVALMLATASWAGIDTITSKFTEDTRGAESVGGRSIIWADTLRIARDFKLTGSGLNTYGTAMILYQSGRPDVHYQEAHNDYLQVAAEGGLLLAVPAIAAVAAFGWLVRRRFREAPKSGSTYWIRVGAVLGIVSIAVQSVFEFSLQMPGNAALFALLAGLALHQSPNLRRVGR